MAVIWGDPPAEAFEPKKRNGRGSVHLENAEMLKGNPGEWGEIGTYKNPSGAASAASTVRSGKRGGKDGGDNAYAPAGSFEAVCAGNAVFARYVGSNQEFA